MFMNGKDRGVRAIAASMGTFAWLAAATQVNARPFSFAGVEYLPRDQRVPAARAFVADKLAPGTPMASALKVLRRADLYCRAPDRRGATITCTHGSFERPPLSAELIDVTWTVKVTPSADGRVAQASVRRSTNGF